MASAAEIVAAWRSFQHRLFLELVAYLDPVEQLELNAAVAAGGRHEDDAVAIIDRAIRRRAAGETPRQSLPMPKVVH